jgi:hypothetical protein
MNSGDGDVKSIDAGLGGYLKHVRDYLGELFDF